MPRTLLTVIALIAITCVAPLVADEKPAAANEDGFVSLFDGKTLDGWTPQDPAADAFKVEDGAILCGGPFTHLFYTGKVNDGKFKNFELRAEFKMAVSSNSGIFFHTENPGPKGKLTKGYECQICGDSYAKDPKKTGSLYDVEDVKTSPAKDEEWTSYTIRVEGKHIVLSINGKPTVDYTEPEPVVRKKGREGRVVSSGAFALQSHDAKSKVWIRNIRVKALP
ncbi:MAG: DUF1080 domain-containing protein [Phycisphaerae bacterium]|nr:DUF1080 domain-containing protein [Tepidisphaeraceae bacterium]